MAPIRTIKNILMELRKICQHPYLSEPELESLDIPEMEQHKQLIEASGKLMFLKLLLPKLKERGHRVLLFSQFKIALDRIEDFLYGENVKFLRLDGDVQQAQRQKSMDLFNAPNSEYDVFLLTTRAGGVGINLATADTVILFDPDFNPHQDLQAIARSHRYGQKKKVLVFKLMVKGSVEENIINKGKKKMVLDHLVVQQMGKESEEGDIDDLLLRGVEAVYSNQGGMNIPDIVYNSKNVDELIDKVEADAEAEAKEMEEREKAIAEGTVEPSKNKSNQQFGFAKIWEADQNQLQNIADENQDDGDGREINWESIIDAMEKERQEKLQQMMMDQTKKKRKAATNVHNVDLSFLSDGDTPTKNNKHKKEKGKGKGKGKILDGSSDYDGKGSNPESDDSEYNEFSDSNMPSELQGLALDQMMARGRSDIPSVPGPSNNALPIPLPHPTLPAFGDNVLPPPHAESSKRPREKEDKEARKRRRLEQKQAELFRKSQQAVNGIVHPPNNHYQQVTPQQQVNQHILEQRYAEARQVLNLMYHILREFGNEKNIRRWALIALPELPPEERIERYRVLAEEVDTHLSSMNQTQYFSLPDQIRSVSLLLVSGGDVVVNGDMGVPDIPPNVGLIVPPRNVVTPVAPAPRIRRKGDGTSNGNTPDPGPVAGPSLSQAQPHSRPVQPQASNLSESLFNNLMDSAPPSCQFCSGLHDLRECENLSSVEDLQAVRRAIMESNDPEPDKTIALKTLERTRSFLIKAGRLPNGPTPTPAQHLDVPSLSHNNLITPSNSIALSESTNGHAVTPVKTPRAKAQASSTKKTPNNTHEVIEIPDSPPLTPSSAEICPFCEKSCGLPIRTCVERNGGRKALKLKIRQCEERIQGGDGSRGIREGQQVLYECYKSWPREKK